MVWKRSIYTVVTPLPPTISRETAVAALHAHVQMIELNPLVINHERCKPPPNAPADEFHCLWYQLTDRVPYLPGIKGQVSYKACFHDLPRGLQTHVYAPAGLDIKERWTIGGNEPGEEREVLELGLSNLGVPREGLYLREDVDMRCNIFLGGFVKKTLNKAHHVLVERLVVKADLADDEKVRSSYARSSTITAANSVRVASPTPSLGNRSISGESVGITSFIDSFLDSMSAPSTSTIPEEVDGDRTIAELPADGPRKNSKADGHPALRGSFVAPKPVELP